MAYRLGRNPRDYSRPAPVLESYLWSAGSGFTPVPYGVDVDRCSKVSSWPMYGNDNWGDCVEAMAGHAFNAQVAYSGQPWQPFTDTEILGLYSGITGFNPNAGPPGQNPTDNGTNIQDLLAYLHTHGLTGPDGHVHQLAGYAAFGNPKDEVLLATALSIFGTVMVGVNLQQAQQEQFGQVWSYEPGSPIEGGHAICLQRRRAGGVGTLDYITWGAVQPSTRSFQWHEADEAWVVVSEDWLTANGTTIEGMNLQQLLGDMADFH